MNSAEHLSALRKWMVSKKVDAVYLTCTDPHQSESVADHWKTVQWFTGFTGSVAWAIVTADKAAFWTDGRYTEQAKRQVDATLFALYSISDPKDPDRFDWLRNHIPKDGCLALDAGVLSTANFRKIQSALKGRDIRFELNLESFLNIWTDRPRIPQDSLYQLEEEFTVRTRREKLTALRKELREAAGEGAVTLVCGLDDVVWLTNLRGHDNPLYPFFHAYMVVGPDIALLMTDQRKVTAEQAEGLDADGIFLVPYRETEKFLSHIAAGTKVVLDPHKTPVALFEALPDTVEIVERPDLTAALKAKKCARELENIHKANDLEAAAVIRLMRWLEKTVGKETITEYDVGQKLNEFRARSELYLQPANLPIVGFADNAAVIHYRPRKEDSKKVIAEVFLLFDVCAQYKCGTTDLTRTVALGLLTEEMKEDYTDVLKANIRLASQKFPLGTTGDLLDAIAKADLWNKGKNFRHGTGHGIGYVSNIHEGPGKICVEYAPAFPYARNTPLEEGMLFSDEPGIYRVGRYGIRIENSIAVREEGETEFGTFLGFEVMTFLPFEHKAILAEKLSEFEVNWIRDYYAECRKRLRPYLDDEEFSWLEKKTEF